MECSASAAGPDWPWIAVNTNPNREHIVLEHLQRQALTAYCPMLRRQRSHARRVETVLRPLFPGYLFVQANTGLQWRPILTTHGVRTVVRAGDDPSFVDDALIAGLKAREIDGGPFDGFIATILELDEKDRLLVLLDVMNRAIKVKLNGAMVAPAYGSL